MNLLKAFVCLALLIFASTESQASHCKTQLKNKQIAMDAIASNIANANTTRTPQGGPYQRKDFRCENEKCEIITMDANAAITYLPGHPDADSFGYVQFPNIDLDEEVSTMVELQRDYESIAASCK